MLQNIIAKAMGIDKQVNQALYEFLFFEAGKLEAPISDVALFVSMVLVEHPQVPDAFVAFPRFNVMHGNDRVREALIVEIVEEKDAPLIGSKVVNFFISESERMNVDVSLLFGVITAGEKESEVKYAEFCDGQFYDMFTVSDVINEKRPSNYQKPS